MTQRPLKKKAIDILSRREYGSDELKKKLLSYSDSECEVDHIIMQLQHSGLLSDQRFTESYIHKRMSSGKGPEIIQQELIARGIDEHLIHKQLNAVHDQWDDILNTLQKKYESKSKIQLVKSLLSKGFSTDMIQKALKITIHEYGVDE